MGADEGFWPIIKTFEVAIAYVFLWLPALQMSTRMKAQLSEELGAVLPSEPGVRVSFEIDGFKYAEDLGKISFEQNWIYFEGVRTSFSLGPEDFVRDWDEAGFGVSSHVVLHLIPTNRRVKLRMHAMSVTDKELRAAFWDWARVSTQAPGISVLPPIEPITASSRIRTEGWLVSAMIGYAAFESALILLVTLHLSWDQPSKWITVGVSALISVCIHRAWLARRRRKAFEAMKSVSSTFEPLGRGVATPLERASPNRQDGHDIKAFDVKA
jgi:hypothetical protein